jgi:hypothetical protein
MRSCCEKFFAAKSIVSRLRKLFRRRGQNRGSAATAPDESSIGTPISQTAERPSSPTVDEDPEPRLADAVRCDEPPLPPNCSRLQPEDVKILGDRPARAGAFTDIWDGSLAGERVAIKSYRIYSTTDPTQARMVRIRWHPQVFWSTDPLSTAEVPQGSASMHQAFPPEHCSVPCYVHHSATPAGSRIRLHGIPRAWGISSGSWWYREGAIGATFISPPHPPSNLFDRSSRT